MTTKIRIENTAPGHKTVRVHSVSLSQKGERYHVVTNEVETLKPGESCEKWIHGGVMVEVFEADDLPAESKPDDSTP